MPRSIRVPKRSAPKKRAAYHHGDLHDTLVQGAIRTISRHGVESLSLRDLARSCGVSPRAPYRHFANKRALLAAVSLAAHHAYEAHLDTAVRAAGDSPLARFTARGVAYVTFAVKNPSSFRMMCAPYDSIDESLPELLQARARLYQGLIDDIGAAQRAGVVCAGEPAVLGLAAWSSMHGLALLLLDGQLQRYTCAIEPAPLAELVGSVVLKGLAPRPGGALEAK